MPRCEICGRDFDPLVYQVVVPELGRGFDRADCARQARATMPVRDGPAAPLTALVEPLPPAEHVPFAKRARRPLAAATNLGLIAAGTVSVSYLWLQVFAGHSSSPSAAVPAPLASDERAPGAETPPTVVVDVGDARGAQRGERATRGEARRPPRTAGAVAVHTSQEHGESPGTEDGGDVEGPSGGEGSGGGSPAAPHPPAPPAPPGSDTGESDGGGDAGEETPTDPVAHPKADGGKHKGWRHGHGHSEHGHGKGHGHHHHDHGGGEGHGHHHHDHGGGDG